MVDEEYREIAVALARLEEKVIAMQYQLSAQCALETTRHIAYDLAAKERENRIGSLERWRAQMTGWIAAAAFFGSLVGGAATIAASKF